MSLEPLLTVTNPATTDLTRIRRVAPAVLSAATLSEAWLRKIGARTQNCDRLWHRL